LSLHLHSLGHAHPDNEISNAFLEELEIGTSERWILERVGIRSRRSVLPLDYIRKTRNREPRAALEAARETNAELGARAARMALARAGLEARDVGLVVCGGSAPDTVTPAEACNVARTLELEVPAFDMNSACTSFLVALHWLAAMRPEALPDYVLLVVPEAFTKTVDYRDRASAVLWGDAAVAAVVSPRLPGCARVLDSALDSDPGGAEKVVVPRLGHFRQQGHAVQMFAIRKTSAGLARLQSAHADPERVQHFVGHQANLRMLEAVCRGCGIPADRHHTNLEWYGNTGAAGAPSVVSMAWEKWSAADDVAVAGVGAGLTWASCLLRFDAAPGSVA
jgi:3-oxoacyl-[acyl-carrier-protein] synthase-3